MLFTFLYKVDGLASRVSNSGYNHFTLYGQIHPHARQASFRIAAIFSGEDGAFDFSLAFDDISLKTLSDADYQSTEILEKYKIIEPVVILLEQNFPNPFNNETILPYVLPVIGEYELHINNLNGQMVRTLITGTQMPGRYTVHWDGMNNSGNKLARGVYIYRLRSGNKVKICKLLMIK